MAFGFFKKKDSSDEKKVSASKALEEAALTAWCRKNEANSGTARMFYEMVQNGMPMFKTDEEAISWLIER